ncbi:Mu-like prophage major head subunit gpT family protein [Oceanobacter sp. 4_MG-2023]|uniref:Mu-like prophage major head subunit gpT family protein n=1 Tax=Oceanobacter sp. 4_MG-2023 TaxID=3062623 RepID=UPI0027326298|nr:Mu-like prophage major head subunit gpT family protein [Oceanobacter sp. 4_MG-2023]MDP2548488.1 Mu-like prophage major head subunit gpT family protein [Oceanobacter sp. 4_MG-2023]
MLVNKQTLGTIFTNIKTTFNKAFDATPTVWPKIAMLMPSTTSQNDYAWLSNFPKMRRWIGAKHIKSLAAHKYTLVNDPYEATIGVHKHQIADDNIGFIGPQAQGAGYSAKQWPDELVIDAVNQGTSQICHDGQYFFDTDHEVGAASVSNKFTLPLDISTLAAAKASYGAVRTAMKLYKDEEGRPLNITPNVLLVGPGLEDDARSLMTNDRLEDGKPNPYKGTAEVVVDARISSDTDWYLLDTTKPVKPFIFQQREKPVMMSLTDITSDHVFSLGEFLFGCEARGAAGYGFWQLAAKGN